MSNENSIWNNGALDEMEFLNFSKENEYTIKVKFLDNEPQATNNKFGTPSFTFDVLDMITNTAKQFTITSKRLMRTLKSHLPIEGKTFDITRIGSGMDTDYEVVIE